MCVRQQGGTLSDQRHREVADPSWAELHESEEKSAEGLAN